MLQKLELALANVYGIGQNFHSCKWPLIEKKISHPATLLANRWLRNVVLIQEPIDVNAMSYKIINRNLNICSFDV